MRTANSFSVPQASGSIGQLQKPISFDSHQICLRLRDEATIPLKNTSGSNYTLTNADAVALMQAHWASINLSFGDVASDVVDDALTFNLYRYLCVALTGHDQIFNGKELRNYASSDSDAIVVPLSNGTVNVVCELHRPFIYERLGHQLTEWCPGTVQMKQLDWNWTRGANFTTNAGAVIENGAASHTVLFDTTMGRQEERWVRPPKLYKTSLASQEISGPADGGALLALLEYTAVGASTALTFFSLLADEDVIHNNVKANRVVRDGFLFDPPGTYDLNALVTTLYRAVDAIDIADLIVAQSYLWKQASLDIATPLLAWVMAPAMSAKYRDQTMGPNIARQPGKQYKAVSEPSLHGEEYPAQHASILPAAIITPDHPKWESVGGRLFEAEKAPVTHIPDQIKTAAARLAGDAAGVARMSVALSKNVPGGTSPQRGSTTQGQLGIAQHVAPAHVKAGAGFTSQLAGFLKRGR